MKKFEELFESFLQMKRLVFQGSLIADNEQAFTKLQFIVLDLVKELEPIPVGELANRLKFSKSSMTQLINRLVKMSFVKRLRDPKDRRSVRLLMTEEGRKEYKKLRKKVMEQMQMTFGFLHEEDMDLLISLHKKIIQHFNK
ncbi:MarR family transcriptional regulator [Patescibacteria group bacterium]|nr:MarR family transcriptional regulator [Patescibacteria group bacterium]